jgi:hypothetical protein
LVKGSFRSITGWIGKNNPARYKIITPTATAGVRGTDHEPLVIPEGSTEGEPGTYDRVHAGSSYIEGKTGRVDVAAGKVGHFAAHGRDRPRVLDQVPQFFRAPRNEKRIEGRHERVLARADQGRAARQKAVVVERKKADERKRAVEQRAQREQKVQQQKAQQNKARQERAQQTQQRAQQARQQKQQAQTQRQQAQAQRQQARQQQTQQRPAAQPQGARQKPADKPKPAPHRDPTQTHKKQ